MDGPGGGDDRLIVLHDDVPGLLALAHHVKDNVVLGDVEVCVNLHPALMGVGGHGVPHAAGGQLGEAHGQLAGGQHVGVDELVDDPGVGGLRRAAGALGGVVKFQQSGLVASVGRGGHQIEPGGIFGTVAGEDHVLCPHGDIQAVLKAQTVLLPVHGDGAGAAQVEHAGLPALQEDAGAEVGPHINALVDGDLPGHGHDAQDHHAVHVGVGGLHLVGLVEALDEELLPELLGGVALDVVGVGGITDIHFITILLSYLNSFSPGFHHFASRSGQCMSIRAARIST